MQARLGCQEIALTASAVDWADIKPFRIAFYGVALVSSRGTAEVRQVSGTIVPPLAIHYS
jgi:hypothetical protein